MTPYHHALSSAARHGGEPADYQQLHEWFDGSKVMLADFRHRALRHHVEGIFLAERLFGVTLTNAAGRQIPVRLLGEQHVKEDLGRIPTVQDWLHCLRPASWMMVRSRSPAVAELPAHASIETENQDCLYRVCWDIDVAAPSSLAAARRAREIQLNPESIGVVFSIVDPRGGVEMIDLAPVD